MSRLGGLLSKQYEPQGLMADSQALSQAMQGRSPNMGLLNSLAMATMPVPVVGDVLGLAADINEYARNPESRTPLNYGLSAMGLLPFMPGITAWHGSPHKFKKFDISKLGTGEGSQMYGHGLYFAEHPNTARYYQLGLTQNNPHAFNYILDGKSFGLEDWSLELTKKLGKGDYRKQDALNRITPKWLKEAQPRMEGGQGLFFKQKTEFRDFNPPKNPFQRGTVDAEVWDELNKRASVSAGHLYKVDIPDEHIANMLDWDARLADQVDVVRKNIDLDKLLPITGEPGAYKVRIGTGYEGPFDTIEYAKEAREFFSEDLTGADLYKLTQARVGSAEKARKVLLDAGVPGVKYLDQISRDAGEGTRNFVLFDDKLVKILERK